MNNKKADKEIIENNNIENFKKYANIFLNSIAFPIVIGILLILKTMLFYQNTINVREVQNIQTLLATTSFILTLVCFICTLPNRARIITTIVADVVISLLLCADNLYYIYSSSVLSIAQITNAQYGEEIADTLPMLFRPWQLLYFIDIFIYIILVLLKIQKIEKKEKANKKQIIARSITGCVGIILTFTICNYYKIQAQGDPFNKDMQIKKGSIYGYHIADIFNSLDIKKQAKYKTKADMEKDYENLKNDYNTRYGESNYDIKGIAKDKNIIILQLESIQEFVINKTLNGKEITPNLNKFMQENIEFTNMYMQSYSSTADSEYSTISSLYPMENGMSFSKYYTNTYDDIFTMFKESGYTTSYMHGNYGFFWNRENVYSRLPVDHLELKEDFSDTSEEIMGYLSDELLYKQAVEKLANYDKPFVSYIVSASSHTSFSLEGLQDRSKISIDTGKYKNTFFGNYLEAVNYADYAFGIFIDELKQKGLYDDTVILLYGDHNGLDMYNEEMLDFLAQTTPELNPVYEKINYINVACGMKIPGISHLKIEKPVSKLDIKPTFAYLCDYQDGMSLGTNMFARKDFICLNNEKIVTSRYYYDGGQWYSIRTGENIDLAQIDIEEKELLERYQKDMETELDISKSISIHNLLK